MSNQENQNNSNQMWGGRFNSKPSSLMQEINQSISFDYQLYRQDILASIVHCKMLAKCNIINQLESDLIIKGLKQIEEEILQNKFIFKIELEDIHMNIEFRLKEIIGDVAGKLHTARSRNDQVATDFRLWVRDEIDDIANLLQELMLAIIGKAEFSLGDKPIIIPGFTHLQIAQPVLFSHHLMAYFEMIRRDFNRLLESRFRMNQSPLGSLAMAGTSFPIDRYFTASQLSFNEPCRNSMDGVSDRDFAIEFLFNVSMISLHLSRFSEELILWSSKGFDFITLSDAFTSGSSIMPQKKNPDAAELVRGKTGRIFGALFSLFTTIKGLTLTYSKDMQEDKEPIFDASKNIKICLQVMIGMIKDMQINQEKMFSMSKLGFSTATDLADWLVKNLKIPFREAHHITGRIVKFAEVKGCSLGDLSLEEMQEIYPQIDNRVFEILEVEKSIASRNSYGGTSQDRVAEAITEAKTFLNKIKL
ncbi:MAG: argininosuccinate lyase [Rickettsiales bacterium]|nr:argininosuccinate lyase [Rickettsiales bacterium]